MAEPVTRRASARAADPNEARVAVPDERFDWLCGLFKPASAVPAYLNVVDIAGLVKGAHEGLVSMGRGGRRLSKHQRGSSAVGVQAGVSYCSYLWVLSGAGQRLSLQH